MVLLDLQTIEAHAEQDMKFISCSSIVDLECVSTFSAFC